MGRNVSSLSSASRQTVQLVVPGADASHTTPVFAKAGWHPNMDGNNFQVLFLNAHLNDAATYGGYGDWGVPGYDHTRGRMYFGLGQNWGWWDQDQGLGDVQGWLDVRTPPGSNGSYSQFFYTPRSGELGNDIINVTRAFQIFPWYVRARAQHGAWHNFRYVNGDVPTRERVLLLDGPHMLGLPRLRLYAPGSDGVFGPCSRKTLAMTASNTLASQTGSASYNHTRGELAVVASSGDTTNRFVIRLYAVRFDERLDVTTIPDTPIVETTVTLASAVWPRWNNEARYRITPVLLDNGDIVLVGFHSSGTTSDSEGLRAVRLTRNADNTFTAPSSATASLATHGATFCMDNDSTWMGMKTMQTYNGRHVLCFAQNYYWGAGFVGFVVDRRTGAITPISHANTNWGYQAVHDGDDGFLIYRQGQDFELAGWNQTEAFRYAPRSDGTMVLWAQTPITKRIWPYNGSHLNVHSGLLEVLP